MARTIGWGLFLACSWTWCIGMFLPVLLVRDFGWLGIVAFAVPNIVGAALFGIILAPRGASESFVSAHRNMVWAFSVVTVAFQAFFLGSLLQPAPISFEQLIILLGTAAVTIGIHIVADRTPILLSAAAAIWLASAMLMVFAARSGHAGPPEYIARAPVDFMSLAGLGAVCALGFCFCPYLDRTFHEARRRLPGRAGTWAFLLGFGVFFAVMISFTALYARAGTLAAVPGDGSTPISLFHALSPIVLGHMVLQLGFTIGAHTPWVVREAPGEFEHSARAGNRLWLLGPAAAGIFLSLAVSGWKGMLGLSAFELAYRTFLAFYGLAFPAYIWICALPLGASPRPTRQSIMTWIIAITLASPAYWTGFMERRSTWLLIGVAIIISARWVGRLFAAPIRIQPA